MEEDVDSFRENNPTGKPQVPYPLRPGWIVLITIVAGLAASGPLTGAALFRCGYRKSGWLTGSILGLLGIAISLGMFFWNGEWYWSTFILTVVHLFFGVAIFFILFRPYRQYLATHPVLPQKRGTYREVITGMVGGAFLGILLGTVCTVFYILSTDRLFSTLMPVVFEDAFTGFKIFIGSFFLTISGIIAGGIVGRLKPRITAGQMILYGLILIFAYFSWLITLEILIAVPGFQAGVATGEGWKAVMAPLLLGNFSIGFWWPAFLLFFIISSPGKLGKFGRTFQVVGINFAAGVTLCITLGYPADIFLSMGRHYEREALTIKAMWCYEHGLRKEPKERIASYLQYRVALSNHKLGNEDKAKQGFRRVVAKYTSNKKLVKKSNQFLDNLDQSTGRNRVVLSGVESCTEYKGGYCVPNSLALAMKYWGSDVTPRIIGRRITGLGSGTFIVNQKWFAEQADFRHDFLPMANLDDIKKCIDKGFPVLVYVPSHVFAIVGYDEALGTFVTYDVATHDVWVEYIQKDFIKAWKKQATTLVLVYPPEKAGLIPENIRKRLVRLSDGYLHFQLHFFDTPTGSISIPHLFKAAGDTGEFFFPITILYADFPGLRQTISEKYDNEVIINGIKGYFWNDFDEGIHLWGQRHNERWAWPDWALRFSMEYLTIHQQFDLMKDLIDRVDEVGQVSKGMLAKIGMINLACGEFKEGLDRLERAGKAAKPFYVGLANLKIKNHPEAIRELVKTIKGGKGKFAMGRNGLEPGKSCRQLFQRNSFFDDSKNRFTLDEYGFPKLAVANLILIKRGEYGESREDLEEIWEEWVHHFPLDAPVANALVKLLEMRVKKIDKKRDTVLYQRLNRKLKLAKSRAARYSIASFSSPGKSRDFSSTR